MGIYGLFNLVSNIDFYSY